MEHLRIDRIRTHLGQHPRLVWCFGYQELPATALCFGDADLAARDTGMRSTGTALSTSEAEFYALSKAATHATQLAGVTHVLECLASAVVGSDPLTSIGIASRQGCGKLRHFEAKWLWVQDDIAAHRLNVRKVPTEVNPADLATKYFLAPRIRAFLVLPSLKLAEAHDKVNARFWYSEQVSGCELVEGLAVLVIMTILLWATLGGDDVSYEPQLQQHCGETQHLALRHRIQQ